MNKRQFDALVEKVDRILELLEAKPKQTAYSKRTKSVNKEGDK